MDFNQTGLSSPINNHNLRKEVYNTSNIYRITFFDDWFASSYHFSA